MFKEDWIKAKIEHAKRKLREDPSSSYWRQELDMAEATKRALDTDVMSSAFCEEIEIFKSAIQEAVDNGLDGIMVGIALRDPKDCEFSIGYAMDNLHGNYEFQIVDLDRKRAERYEEPHITLQDLKNTIELIKQRKDATTQSIIN